MATVTGYTAEHIQELIDTMIASAAVVGGNLILTLHNGGTVNAGSVIGPTGATGATGTVVNLDSIPDVDTTGVDVGDVLVWNGTNWVAGINIKVQGTAPSSPDLNDLWVDTSS